MSRIHILLLLVLLSICNAGYILPFTYRPPSQNSNYDNNLSHGKKQSSGRAHNKKFDLVKGKTIGSQKGLSKGSKIKLRKANENSHAVASNKKARQHGINQIDQDIIDANAHKIGFNSDKGNQVTKFNNERHNNVDNYQTGNQRANAHKKSIRKGNKNGANSKSFANHALGDDQQEGDHTANGKYNVGGRQSARSQNQNHNLGNQVDSQGQSMFALDQQDQAAANDFKKHNRQNQGDSTSAISRKKNNLLNYLNNAQSLKRNKNKVYQDNQSDSSENNSDVSDSKNLYDKDASNKLDSQNAIQGQNNLGVHSADQGHQNSFFSADKTGNQVGNTQIH
jgi:hypothetical protein